MNRSNAKNRYKLKLAVILGILMIGGGLVPSRLMAGEFDEFAVKEARANKYFERGLDALADRQDGSLYACANVGGNAEETAQDVVICSLFSLPASYCAAVGAFIHQEDPHNGQVAASLKVALFGEFQFAMGYFAAHPDRSGFVTTQLAESFRGILDNAKYNCQDSGQALDDLNNLAARTLFAYILAPAITEAELISKFSKNHWSDKLSINKLRP